MEKNNQPVQAEVTERRVVPFEAVYVAAYVGEPVRIEPAPNPRPSDPDHEEALAFARRNIAQLMGREAV